MDQHQTISWEGSWVQVQFQAHAQKVVICSLANRTWTYHCDLWQAEKNYTQNTKNETTDYPGNGDTATELPLKLTEHH